MAKRNRIAKRNRGGLALAALGVEGTELARVFGVDKSSVTLWKVGKAKPNAEKRKVAEETYGIPAAAWDELLVEGSNPSGSTPLNAPKGAQPAVDPSGDAQPAVDPSLSTQAEDVRAYVHREIARIRADQKITELERVRVLDKLVAINERLDKSTGENAITIQRILAHRDFKQILQVLVEAISRHPPEVAEDLARALRKLEGS